MCMKIDEVDGDDNDYLINVVSVTERLSTYKYSQTNFWFQSAQWEPKRKAKTISKTWDVQYNTINTEVIIFFM